MTKKMTRWFQPHEKPVRKGVYEIKDFNPNTVFAYWNGHKWMCSFDAIDIASHCRYETSWQDKSWRGFMKDQNE